MITPNLLKGKNILFRADLDVPVEQGKVTNDFRLQALLPSLKLCLENAASTLIIGHLGRPSSPSELVERGAESQFGLNPIREWLEKALNQSIFFIYSGFSPGEWAREQFPIAMFDNLRFHPGELNNDREFAAQILAGSDIYIYEAFAAYNKAMSLRIIPEVLPTLTGIQFDREVEALSQVIKNTDKPSLLILSGSKEDKKDFVDKFVDKFDEILLGGKLAAMVQPHGNVISASLTEDGFDIDEASATLFTQKIMSAKTVVVNGPLGRFEDGLHVQGTRIILEAAKNSGAKVIIGGGDTLAAIPALGFSYSDFDFVSTGGGAMLEFLATGTHPLLDVLRLHPPAV
ncbi:phosphoglycerate kinase [Candidatus Collierbacteria bacterium]|nr:phosphoglycerate kinase [Candidatus Collierbacteria bacterium]